MRKNGSTKTAELRQRRDAPLKTPTDLTRSATKDVAGAMNAILADVFALYLKTKNFHWHMSGPHFRDYHLLLDEQGDQLFRDDRSNRGASSKDWRTYDQIDRPHLPSSTRPR
jgi:starvation-inducible DNA-binding protein